MAMTNGTASQQEIINDRVDMRVEDGDPILIFDGELQLRLETFFTLESEYVIQAIDKSEVDTKVDSKADGLVWSVETPGEKQLDLELLPEVTLVDE